MSKVRQVNETIVGKQVSSETTTADFIENGLDGDIQLIGADGQAPEKGKPFKVMQKTDNLLNASGYEFSTDIFPKNIDKITVAEYEPEVQRKVSITVDEAKDHCTYVAEIRIFNPNGVLSVENFEVVSGYFVTGEEAETEEEIAEGLARSLKSNLRRRGDSEFTVEVSGAELTIESKEQVTIPGKMDGRPLEFIASGKVFRNAGPRKGIAGMTTEVEEEGFNGRGTGKQVVTKEWFDKGFKYDVYRQTAYPADLSPAYYAEIGGKYNTIIINFYKERSSTLVEKQFQSVSIFIEDADNEETNNILAALRDIVDEDIVPEDLA